MSDERTGNLEYLVTHSILLAAQARIAELEKDIERWLIVGSDAGETIQNLESQLKAAKDEVALQTGKADYLRNEFKSLKEYADGSVDIINDLHTEIERLKAELERQNVENLKKSVPLDAFKLLEGQYKASEGYGYRCYHCKQKFKGIIYMTPQGKSK